MSLKTNRFKEEVSQDDPLPRNNDESTEDGITGEVKTIDRTKHESTRKPEDDGKTESLILGHTLEVREWMIDFIYYLFTTTRYVFNSTNILN